MYFVPIFEGSKMVAMQKRDFLLVLGRGYNTPRGIPCELKAKVVTDTEVGAEGYRGRSVAAALQNTIYGHYSSQILESSF